MIAIAWKGTIILLAMFAAAWLLRNRSAALRHCAWTAGFAALLLLPLSLVPAPSWVPIAAVPDSGITRLIVSPATRAAPGIPVPWMTILYAAGCAIAVLRFAIGAGRTAWISSHAERTAEWSREFGVRVVTTPEAPMPMAWGVLRPSIILPAAASAWPEARLRTVLLHERMHLERRDLLTHAIAQLACCVYWFHPLAWIGLGRLRQERERACDNAVIASGIAAHDYAAHLMDVVRAVASRRDSWADAPAMADSSNLESRVRALLDRGRDRRPLSRASAAGVTMGAVLLLIGVAVLKLDAQAAGGSIAGTVTDPSGAVVPRCRVLVRALSGTSFELSASTDAVGHYRFTSLPPGEYAVEFGAPGFAALKTKAALVAGAAARLDGNLELGGITEAVTVQGSRNSPAAMARPASTPQRIKVGGNVQPSKLITQSRPEYPADLQQAGVEGTVMIRAVVSTNGVLMNPQVVNTVDARLAKLALDGIARWVYQPALLNGEAVETGTTISIDFRLGQ
jgi:TonB family protein